MISPAEQRRVVLALCVTQLTGWGILYYAYPVMLAAVAADTGWSTSTAFGAFSVGLLASAVAAPRVGRLLDRVGPRAVMGWGSVLGAVSLLGVAAAPNLFWFVMAWAVVGLAQAAVLYAPAFAALTRWCGSSRVAAITTVTLAGGLAGTVFAPLTALLLRHLSWQGTTVALAVILAVVTIPLHALALTPAWPGAARSPGQVTHDAAGEDDRTVEKAAESDRAYVRRTSHSRPFAFLLAMLGLTGFGLFGATLNLIPFLTERGMGHETAAVIFGLVGVGQLFGRFGYPALSGRLDAPARAALVLGFGAVMVLVLAVFDAPLMLVVAASVGAGVARGIYTLLQATSVSDRWGTRSFGALNGIATVPATVAMVAAPAGAAFLAELVGSYTTAFYLLAALTVVGAALALGSGVRPRGGQTLTVRL
ncbi:MFS transporter [Ornithinimicrobium cryptoxanthini]|uniref:MFS transporter n=1 Tax=Ornithinimicrobium cryptoxanthini TaxID=2934161 RepID=A0ABY4YEN7_9MICO|nr:MFS transporter [Ornithinimicrobium cryptoxanthini]USQ75203.1 MFS transporter [Ornithinimicrobium cryptoxanthini]